MSNDDAVDIVDVLDFMAPDFREPSGKERRIDDRGARPKCAWRRDSTPPGSLTLPA